MALRRIARAGLSAMALLVAASCARSTTPADPPRFEAGREATAQEIAAWDTDVNGKGEGLPTGRGSVSEGAELYARACAACHGANGEGGAGSQLVKPAVIAGRPRRNIATHWPYAPPLFDYIRRTMPPADPWSLGDDQVYALIAYLLAENGIIQPSGVIDAQALKRVTMPSHGRFVPDDRRGGPVVK
ncbi:MAG: cytochrome c [Acidobacteriota bacterium]|nr:cytochrome c [Acidobacteriota bacterium]